MKKYLAALCAMCLVLLGAALAETDIRLADAGVEAGVAWRWTEAVSPS